MRVGKGNEDSLDEAIVGEAGMGPSNAPSNSLISDKDMIPRFLALWVSQVALRKSVCTLVTMGPRVKLKLSELLNASFFALPITPSGGFEGSTFGRDAGHQIVPGLGE